MHLGEQTLDQEILTTMFGVSNFEELSKSLKGLDCLKTENAGNAGKAGKRAAKIKSWKLPPRTPEWTPLDCAIWSRIEDDALTLAGPKETKGTYGKKLRKAALGLGPAYVQKVCGAMKERIQGVYAAQGHHYKKD